ncbi:MAG TPA: segregation/condensation protein A [Nitrospiria bacterium]|nr:segregation/condensation protein A [Nitrospiria bacterium]
MDDPRPAGDLTAASPVNLPSPDANSAADVCHIVLENFQGPMDLLLHLIKEQQLNIYDIPIALITRQYLGYLEVMTALNVNVAGEFLVMAATLIHIKSRMLLPVPEDGEPVEEDGEDPREELVRRLVEYQRYKGAAKELEQRAEWWQLLVARPADHPAGDDDGLLLSDLQLFDLVAALQRVIARLPAQTPFVISTDELSVKERMASILEELSTAPSCDFFGLCAGAKSRYFVIVTFLAVLELIKLQLMAVESTGNHQIVLRRPESAAASVQGSDPGGDAVEAGE